MIWGYHYFWKHPYVFIFIPILGERIDFDKNSFQVMICLLGLKTWWISSFSFEDFALSASLRAFIFARFSFSFCSSIAAFFSAAAAAAASLAAEAAAAAALFAAFPELTQLSGLLLLLGCSSSRLLVLALAMCLLRSHPRPIIGFGNSGLFDQTIWPTNSVVNKTSPNSWACKMITEVFGLTVAHSSQLEKAQVGDCTS